MQLVVICFACVAVLLVKWKDLMAVFFDESHARSVGLNPPLLKVLFFTMLSASTVAALQTVGAFLVICMVVTPGATAYLLTARFGRMLAIATGIGSGPSRTIRSFSVGPSRYSMAMYEEPSASPRS